MTVLQELAGLVVGPGKQGCGCVVLLARCARHVASPAAAAPAGPTPPWRPGPARVGGAGTWGAG
eukprot:12112281-Alexandrium_andersonii.AAC.1